MGKISDIINGMISRSLGTAEFTSASPGFINTLIQINDVENPDLEAEIRELCCEEKSESTTKTNNNNLPPNTKINDIEDKLDLWEDGNIGAVRNLTAAQFSNVKSLATNPSGFLMNIFFRKFSKGVGVVALALIIFEAVKWVVGELYKPGRLLDIRFKRDIRNEIISFRRREEQQKIRQGVSSIIITTIPRLRGGYSQVTNTLDIAGGRIQVPSNFGMNSMLMVATSGVNLKRAYNKRYGGP